MGRWHHRIAKYADLLITQEREGSVFGFFHPETRFQKSAFTGSVWPIGQTMQSVRLHTKAFPCGRPLNVLLHNALILQSAASRPSLTS